MLQHFNCKEDFQGHQFSGRRPVFRHPIRTGLKILNNKSPVTGLVWSGGELLKIIL
jgi:hypothetical protein